MNKTEAKKHFRKFQAELRKQRAAEDRAIRASFNRLVKRINRKG